MALEVACQIKSRTWISQASSNTLQIKSAISSGKVMGVHVGGHEGRWEYFVVGPAMKQLQNVICEMKGGDVLCSAEANNMLQDYQVRSGIKALFTTEKTAGGNFKICTILHHVDPPPMRFRIHEISMLDNKKREQILQALSGYVQGPILHRLEHGLHCWDEGQIRSISTVFVNISNLQYPRDIGRSHRALVIIQKQLENFGGILRQFVVDDKGTVCIALFGVISYGNDALRAALFSNKVRHLLSDIGLESSCGISTGDAYVGVLGGNSRRDYVAMGDHVNMSARLMSKASCEVLCDTATMLNANQKCQYTRRPPLNLKGRTKNVDVFRVTTQNTHFPSKAMEVNYLPLVNCRQHIELFNKEVGCILNAEEPQRNKKIAK